MTTITTEGKIFRHKKKGIRIKVIEDAGDKVIAKNLDTGEYVAIGYTFALHWTDEPAIIADETGSVDLTEWC